MHFPRAQIFHEEINVEVDFSELSGICGEREEDGENSSDFGNGLSYVSRASSRAVSEEDTEIEEFGVPIRLDNPWTDSLILRYIMKCYIPSGDICVKLNVVTPNLLICCFLIGRKA